MVLIGQDGMSLAGFGFVRDLRKALGPRCPPLLFMPSSEDFRVRELLLKNGFGEYLPKPIDPRRLRHGVSSSISRVVEESWDSLPAPVSSALGASLAAFGSVVSAYKSGAGSSYAPVRDAAVSIVKAVSLGHAPAMLDAVALHDGQAQAHCFRVSVLMAAFGRAMGLDRQSLSVVAGGGLLHDVGMLAVPSDIARKPSPLTQSELRTVRAHLGLGVRVLSSMDGVPKGVSSIVAGHHERLDGSGYPNSLPASAIDELARMSAIVDVFCGMVDPRSHRPSKSAHEAFGVLMGDMSRKLDMRLAAVFRDMVLSGGLGVSDRV